MSDASSFKFAQRAEMARRLNEFDWAGAGYVPPEQWPETLRATLNMMLDSPFPMMLACGPELRLLYNDGYIPILQGKHPVIWRTTEETFPEIWPMISELIEEVRQKDAAIERKNLLMPFFRRGFLEETYFTFSYSPVRDHSGATVAILSTAMETTAEVIGARRDKTLRELAAPMPPVAPAQAIRKACAGLGRREDIPFHAVFVRDEDGVMRPVSFANVELAPGTSGEALQARAVRPDDPFERVPSHDLDGLTVAPEALARASTCVIARFGGAGDLRDDDKVRGIALLGVSDGVWWDDAHEAFLRRVVDLVGAQFDTQRIRLWLLDRAENRYLRLFRSALDGILLATLEGEILAANPSACRLLGYDEGELIEGGLPRVRPRSSEGWAPVLRGVARTGAFEGELELEHREGDIVVCEVLGSAFEPVEGNARVTIVLRDVTDRRLLQAQLAEAQKMEVIARLSRGIAHDFNNFLTVIGVQSQLLRSDTEGNPRANRDLDLLDQASDRAGGLIRRLLEFSRGSGGESVSFDVVETIQEMSPLLRRLAGSATELGFDLAAGIGNVSMPSNQFEQVLMNLVLNASEALEQGGDGTGITVTASAGPAPDTVRIAVRDGGLGIAPDHLDHIFDAFFTTKPRGTGIGLNTVHRIVEDVGGTIHVDSQLGVGTTFTVTLPTTDAPAERRPPSRPLPADLEVLDGVRVLLVEDQAHVRTVLSSALTRAGAQVTEAANGEEALRALDDTSVDLVISDVVMPLMSGTELARKARARRPDIPLLMMSGYTGDEILDLERLEGVVFLEKPFSAERLISCVRDVLGGD